MKKKYNFDDWKDAKIIKEKLSSEQCELLHDILTNSKLIDDRPDDFDWEDNNYDCETEYDLYYEGYFKISTIEKYRSLENELLKILLVAESFENIDYLIEGVKLIYDVLNKTKFDDNGCPQNCPCREDYPDCYCED